MSISLSASSLTCKQRCCAKHEQVYNTHSEFLRILRDALPVFDVLCKRSLSFLHTCITSDCHIVKNTSRYTLEHMVACSPSWLQCSVF